MECAYCGGGGGDEGGAIAEKGKNGIKAGG